jgi:hypothetical protein
MEVNALRDELRAALDAIEMARDIAPHAEDEDFGNFPMILPESAIITKKPFDLDPEISGLNLRLLVYGDGTTSSFVSLRGVPKNVTCGSGWTISGGYCLTLSGSKLIYLKYSRASAGVSIESANSAAAAFVTPDDFTYRPLWFIAVADDAIDLENCIDLRDSYFVDGIS